MRKKEKTKREYKIDPYNFLATLDSKKEVIIRPIHKFKVSHKTKKFKCYYYGKVIYRNNLDEMNQIMITNQLNNPSYIWVHPDLRPKSPNIDASINIPDYRG